MMLPVVTLATAIGTKRSADELSDFDVDQFNSLKDFEAHLTEYLNGQDAKKRDLRNGKRSKVETEATATSFMWDDSVFDSVLTRCRQQPEFWDTSSMVKIVKSRALPTRFLPQLFECIFKHDSPALIKQVRKSQLKIPESILVESLKFALRTASADEELMETIADIECWEDCPLDHQIAYQIMDIIRYPFVEETLQIELTKLWPNEVMCFIQFLQYVQHRISPALVCHETFQKSSLKIAHSISEELVHTWLDLTLNVHLPTLISSAKFVGVVKTLKKFVHDQIKFTQELQSFAPLVEHISTGDVALPQTSKKSNALYSYKTLTF